MSLAKNYASQEIENKWYSYWEDKGYFHSTPDERESYSILMPPPNVTGVLHMGHMLNNTIQDALIRKARLDGKNACWIPGLDHASIATEAKVVKLLREQGIKKSDLTREEFLKHAWEWKEKYGGIILQQLRKLGASCDWDRTSFTMDEERSVHVLKAFVDLYNSGKLYRGKRMVNWDPEAQTVLSNEEVLHKEESGRLFYLKYKVEGSEEYLIIATTRPETLLGDTAVAIHPEDDRFSHLKGKKVIVPLINRSVPLIFDDYVDREFGTGALKVTPAHDVNDYELGKKHNLETIEILNANGSISEAGQLFVGEDRFKARKLIVKQLEEENLLEKIENYTHSVGRSERTNAVIEPRLSLQWYVDMQQLVKPALDNVVNNTIEFFPKNQKNLYRHWMENIRDWCISRQLWWGHRIPAWYYEGEVFVAMTAAEALAQAQDKFSNKELTLEDLSQDEDVLDTWFSSWLWPVSVFDGFNDPEQLKYYYPTSVLVTGWDIIFLWVARMAMAGYEWQNEKPFDHVYFTGMVRDKKRRKMSKSLGNSPDALELIEKFGADGVRFGMLSCSPAGGDLLFDDKLCEQGRNFCNKMWNALNLIKSWEIDDSLAMPDTNAAAFQWFEMGLSRLIEQSKDQYTQYRLSEVVMDLYNFVWGDFCSWLLEIIKPAYQAKIDKHTVAKVQELYATICTVLHPFMPFITEEIWHNLDTGVVKSSDCIMSSYPSPDTTVDKSVIKDFELVKSIVSSVRDIRNKNGLKLREELPLFAVSTDSTDRLSKAEGLSGIMSKLAITSRLQTVSETTEDAISFVIGTDKYFVEVKQEIDVAAEIIAVKEDLKYQQGFVKSVQGKLSNERFVNNAPEAVVNNERKKLQDGQERIVLLEETLKKLEAKV